MPPEKAESTRQFVIQWTQHARSVFAYLLSIVGNRADAEELLQETSTLAWEKFDTFEPGTHFAAWACRIAHYKVLEFRRSKHRDVQFLSDSVLEAVNEIIQRDRDELDSRRDALAACVQKLRPQDRELIRLRYREEGSVGSVAAAVGRSTSAVYKSLTRIHDSLFDCVTRTTNAEGHA